MSRIVFMMMVFWGATVAAQPIHSSVLSQASAAAQSIDDARPIAWPALKASAYIGTGALAGGLVGWWLDRKLAGCPKNSLDCGLGPPGWIIIGTGVGWIAGTLGFNQLEEFSGRGFTVVGGLIGAFVGLSLGVGLADLNPDETWQWAAPLGLAFAGLSVGGGFAHVLGGRPDAPHKPMKTRSTLMPAPVGQGGLGLNLAGRF